VSSIFDLPVRNAIFFIYLKKTEQRDPYFIIGYCLFVFLHSFFILTGSVERIRARHRKWQVSIKIKISEG